MAPHRRARRGPSARHSSKAMLHAQQPLVTLGAGDAEGQVAGPQARMAELLLVERRAAQPAAKDT